MRLSVNELKSYLQVKSYDDKAYITWDTWIHVIVGNFFRL